MILGWKTFAASAAAAGALGAHVVGVGPAAHHHAVPVVRGGAVTDLRWLPAALRDAGLPVVEEPGWKTRGHDTPLRARAVILHHDASPPGPSPDTANYLRTGFGNGADQHYDAQVWVDRAGRWHMIAAGSAQHAGDGKGWGAIHRDSGNVESFGVETDHTTGEAWPRPQLDSIRRGLAAICEATGWDPATSVVGHKEYAPGRKTDPAGIDMARLRREVAALVDAALPPLVREVGRQAGTGNVADAMLLGALLEGGHWEAPWAVGDHGAAFGPFQLHGYSKVGEDPREAVRIMLPRYRAGCASVPAASWKRDPRGSAATCAYRAERPAAMYPTARVAAAWARLRGQR